MAVAPRADGTPATFTVTTDNAHLFAAAPTIDPTGQLSYTPAPNAAGQATVTITIDDGDPTSADDTQSFTIEVAKPHPLYNAAKPCDVNADGSVAPGDVLSIINWINAHGTHSAAAEGEAGAGTYYDVDRDNAIAPIDALLVINYINAHPVAGGATGSGAAGEGESSATNDQSLLALLAQDTAEATQGRRRTP